MSVMRHREITAQMIRDANGGLSPYPISKIVGNEWLHPDGSITPMTTPLSDPRPAATEAAELRDAIEIQTGLSATTVAEVLTAIADAGYRLTGARPPSGQVTISEQTRQIAWAVLIERANDYIDAQELTPHYGTTATIGTPWDSAIAELAALKGAAR